ncbi:MAG TPA: phosphotransferase [Anaerolineales bacterium]|nr:phosphotransferase [Anaerolineales bacterium]
MKIPKNKWRELLVDPFALNLGPELALDRVLGYPPAGNDVLLCRGRYKGQPIEFYLKLPRHTDANFANEAAALIHLAGTAIPAPKVLAYGQHEATSIEFLAVTAMPGERMSGTLTEPRWQGAKSNIHPYVEKIAESLVSIHTLVLDWPPVQPRSQYFIPTVVDVDNPSAAWLREQIFWLEENKPDQTEPCFVHGDHHYANLLWAGDSISAVLDWELCGMGWREFDIAWSLLPRPGQRFFNTLDHQRTFLDVYQVHQPFDHFSVAWCFTLIAVHFLSLKSFWYDQDYHQLLKALSGEHLAFVNRL